MTTVFVTGGTGLTGANVCEQLIGRGDAGDQRFCHRLAGFRGRMSVLQDSALTRGETTNCVLWNDCSAESGAASLKCGCILKNVELSSENIIEYKINVLKSCRCLS